MCGVFVHEPGWKSSHRGLWDAAGLTGILWSAPDLWPWEVCLWEFVEVDRCHHTIFPLIWEQGFQLLPCSEFIKHCPPCCYYGWIPVPLHKNRPTPCVCLVFTNQDSKPPQHFEQSKQTNKRIHQDFITYTVKKSNQRKVQNFRDLWLTCNHLAKVVHSRNSRRKIILMSGIANEKKMSLLRFGLIWE